MTDGAPGDTSPAELQRLDLERYKAKLEFRKFIWGTVVGGIAIVAIPPLFQLATAVLEYVKSEAARRMQAQQFRDGYVKDFLNTALNQDIEVRIRFAKYFASVSSEKDDWSRYLGDLTTLRDTKKSEIDKLEEAWQRLDRPGAVASEVNQARRHLDWAYSEVGYVAPNRSAISNPRVSYETKGPGLSLSSIQIDRQPIAQKILDAFAAAGFGQFQQAAALANAIAESALDPNAQASSEAAFGLFQISRRGLGANLPSDKLLDPDTNIEIIVAAAKKVPRFAAANSLDEAVEAFVRFIAMPPNQTSEVIRRQQIARQLLRS